MKVTQVLNPLLLFTTFYTHWNLLLQLTLRQVAMRYRGSLLGWFWTFSQPLLMLSVYTFVFGIIFKARWGMDVEIRGGFSVIMFCGMSVFNIFSESLNNSTACILNNPNLVKKVIFPLEILPVTQVLATSIHGLVWFLLTMIGAILLGFSVGWQMILFPILFTPLFFLSLGISFFVSSLAVYARDVIYLTNVITQILFFVTPIFYPVDMVPEKLRIILYCNPLTWIVQQTREILLFAHNPDWFVCGILWIASFFLCHLCLLWFLQIKKGFADVL